MLTTRQCQNKRPYTPEESKAKIKAKAQEGIKLRRYLCPVCGLFHLTKMEKKEFEARQERFRYFQSKRIQQEAEYWEQKLTK